MIAAWLRAHLEYSAMSTPFLQATLAALKLSGLFAQQRQAIAHELAMRDWAAFIEERIANAWACVWTERGGRS